jgi:hypothetical protein
MLRVARANERLRSGGIEEDAFHGSPLSRIDSPSPVEMPGTEFFSVFHSLISVPFESKSRLARIETDVFNGS